MDRSQSVYGVKASSRGLFRPLIFFTLSALLFFLVEATRRIIETPLITWNNIRFAWTLSVLHGYPLYIGIGKGPLLCVNYGPLAAWVYLPATLALSPTLALIWASGLAAGYYFLPILWLCIEIGKKFLNDQKIVSTLYAFACFGLLTIGSPALRYSAFFIHADAPALGMGMIACVLVYRYSEDCDCRASLILAALFSAFAVWTKLSMLPLLAALPTYIFLRHGREIFKRFVLYLFCSMVALVVIFSLIFSVHDWWVQTALVLARNPWERPNKFKGLAKETLTLAGEIWRVIALMVVCFFLKRKFLVQKSQDVRGWCRSNPWALFICVGLFMTPLALAANAKLGGDINSLSFTLYFIYAGFLVFLMHFFSNCFRTDNPRFQNSSKIGACALMVGLMLIHFQNSGGHFEEGAQNFTETAYKFIKKHPGETYFPFNPTAHLMAEGRLHHDPWAIFFYEKAGFKVSGEDFKKFLPNKVRWVAFPGKERRFLKEKILSYFPGIQKNPSEELPGWDVYRVEYSRR